MDCHVSINDLEEDCNQGQSDKNGRMLVDGTKNSVRGADEKNRFIPGT